MASFKRQTARLCRLSELKKGVLKRPGEATEPLAGGVLTHQGLMARVNIIGIVVERPSENTLVLDDGSSTISCKRFDEREIDAGVGDVVLVIGKPREFNDERYLVLEICKRLANKGWMAYRHRELEAMTVSSIREDPTPCASHVGSDTPQEAQTPVQTVAVQQDPVHPAEAIIARIRELDQGKGADMQEFSSPEDERIVKGLLEEGEIFEVRPGRLKILE